MRKRNINLQSHRKKMNPLIPSKEMKFTSTDLGITMKMIYRLFGKELKNLGVEHL